MKINIFFFLYLSECVPYIWHSWQAAWKHLTLLLGRIYTNRNQCKTSGYRISFHSTKPDNWSRHTVLSYDAMHFELEHSKKYFLIHCIFLLFRKHIHLQLFGLALAQPQTQFTFFAQQQKKHQSHSVLPDTFLSYLGSRVDSL